MLKKKKIPVHVLVCALALSAIPLPGILFPQTVAAEAKLCAKKKVRVRKGRMNLASALAITEDAECGKGFREIPGALNDGSHIYGRGVDGAKVISTDTTLSPGGHQYESFVVNAGVTLTIPSGTVIRTTGDFTNNGSIVVQTFIRGGRENRVTSAMLTRAAQPSSAGIARASSGISEFGDASLQISGVNGVTVGVLGSEEFRSGLILIPGPVGGGGGGAGDSDAAGGFPGAGGDGGGTLVVLSRGSISNTGTIDASGEDVELGGGGGGGGVLVFAARQSFSSTGSITAKGGFGGLPNTKSGAGGGGGGGGVTVVSPSISGESTINVSGGVGVLESATGFVTENPRSTGGAGGASYGFGGDGGDVRADGTATETPNGGEGAMILLPIKPEGIF